MFEKCWKKCAILYWLWYVFPFILTLHSSSHHSRPLPSSTCSVSIYIFKLEPAIPPLGIYAKLKTLIQKDTFTEMFIVALFSIVKMWKQHKHATTDEWIKKMQYVYAMEYYSVIKRVKFCHFQQYAWTWKALHWHLLK